MSKSILSILLFLIATNILAQVGIGTEVTDPNIILQVESTPLKGTSYNGGLLFPRLSLSSTVVFAPATGTPATGLMIYNTATNGAGETAVIPGFYYWDNTDSNWHRMAQKNASATSMFSNQDTKTDINSGSGIYADLFANVRFNNNTSLYEKVNNSTLRINETGYYKVILNLDLASDGGADNFGIEVVVNNTDDIVSDNIYIPGRWDSEGGEEAYFPNGRSFIIYVPINVAGHTLRVKTYELDPGTDVYFKNPDTSTISIEKIR